ncbi:GNAT family N-acetyltransferase [Actinomadura parmotrematis]|uniref:GNAT family N-acetyltransferase n=1 Tax=Actinomadura parmotrematis TaxID=2864039 RepID=A0ABS7FRY5_9ACTN|nr:GNAT family N-acetyltransferase [Actinomadura parmotrematis]MBW8483071.1 GNAT family N-acetyltransferase [Actinomadura parmotrematis]
MTVLSLGFRSDLMLLGLQGSTVEQRDGHLAVRTPGNPGFYWGNFLLLAGPPAPGTVAGWVEVFRRAFPDAAHVAIGIDGVAGLAGHTGELAGAGLDIDRNTVMTASAVRPPPRPNEDAEFRVLAGDADWRAALELRVATHADAGIPGYREFAERHLTAMRRLQDRGHGAWFGAFQGGRMVSGLGVFGDGSGTVRYQSVDTHPEHRNQGLAGTLVHLAGRYALERMAARTLVIVADPGYAAIRIYRSVGFTDSETQVQLQRTPSPHHGTAEDGTLPNGTGRHSAP